MNAYQDAFAVLLNPNARRVSSSVYDRIAEIVDPEDVYVTQHADDADSLVESLVERGYRTIFTGGGDGTVNQVFNALGENATDTRVGILRLGTGNAMAEIVSSGNPFADLRTFAANPSADSYHLGLCESEGTRFAFAGLGLDAAILNDYRTIADSIGDGPMGPLIRNLGGYFLATFGITAPRQIKNWLMRRQPTVRITNQGDDAFRIHNDGVTGRVGKRFRKGEVIFEGSASSVGYGTCPFYGYGLKMLPFAGVDPNYFHLRVSDVPWPALATRIPSLWNGTLTHPKLNDFHANQIHIEYSEPMPYQLAGEAMGMRQELTVKMASSGVDLVRFI